MRENPLAVIAGNADVVMRLPSQVVWRALDEILRVRLHPGMIEPRVVGHKVEHQPQAALPETLTEAGQRGIAAKVGVHRVAGDREARTSDVFLTQVRQRFLKLTLPAGIAARHLLPCEARLPHAEQPHPIKAQLGQMIQLGVGDVVQGGPAAQPGRQFGQPDAGVDLIEQRKSRAGQGGYPCEDGEVCNSPSIIIRPAWSRSAKRKMS